MIVQLIRAIIPTAAFIGYLVWAALSFAATPRSEVVVTDSNVTLGDIFDGAGAVADRVFMAAPAAGRSFVLDSATLGNLARANGIAWQPTGSNDFVKIERASQRFDATTISESVLTALALPAPALGRISVQMDNPQMVLDAPLGAPAALEFSGLTTDSSGQRFAGLARLKVGEQIVAQASVAGRIVTTIDVPVLTRPMRRDEVIGATDITWQPTELAAGNANVIFNAEDLIGKKPRTGLRPGTPVRMADLVTPALIARGEQVTMLYQVGRMTITAQGRALADAIPGQSVRVVNLSSSRTVEGVAEESGIVRIGPAPVRTAAGMAAGPSNVTLN